MKKAWICMLICLCFSTTAMADGMLAAMTDAAANLEEWRQELKGLRLTEQENASAYELMEQTLAAVSSFGMIYAAGDVSQAENIGDIVQRDEQYRYTGENSLVQTGIFWLNEMSAYVVCDIIYRDNYVYLTDSMYDQSGLYLGTEYLELGKCDDQLIIALVRYDALLNITSRYAMRIQNGMSDFVQRITMGKHLEIVLDVNAWQQGAELDSWNDRLLLPAGY